MEKVLVDLNAYMRHAREVWGYEKVVLLGWSGGGPLALFFQSQAEHPTVRATPAGEPPDLSQAALLPADGIIFQAANISRALLLSQTMDPSVIDENDPDRRIVELDIFNPANPNKPPFSADYITHYRAAQLARMRRRTAWVKETLERLRKAGGKEQERGFVTHRTMADLRYVDPTVDPNDRPPGVCVIGDPESANSGPAGWARYSTLRSWLSQWSIDDCNVDGARAAAAIKVPLMVMENSADEACPPADPKAIFAAAGSPDKTMHVLKGAKHYYQKPARTARRGREPHARVVAHAQPAGRLINSSERMLAMESVEALGAQARPSQPLAPVGPPAGHHHLAWVTHDVEKTVDFYTRVLRMPLVNAVADDHIPSTGEPHPYIHIFFRLGDGSTLAFFEAPGVPRFEAPTHPANVAFNHVALGVADRAAIRTWRDWLRACGVDVIEHDHGIIHSLYFFDPNGVRLEITTTIDPLWNDRESEATRSVNEWVRVKNEARAAGDDPQ